MFFCTFLLVSTISSCLSSPPKEVKPIPVPRFYRIYTHDYGNVTLGWDPIPADKIDKDHPILGFRIKLWPSENIKLFYEDEVGSKKILKKISEQIRKNIHMEPETEPIVVTVGPNEISGTAFGIKDCTHYQVKVQAFTDLGDGPYSSPSGFKILGKECDRKEKIDDDNEEMLEENNNDNVTQISLNKSNDDEYLIE